MSTHLHRRRTAQGFTLIEVLVVVAIRHPGVGGHAMRTPSYLQRSRVPAGLDALQSYFTRMEQRFQDSGNYAQRQRLRHRRTTVQNYTVTCAITGGGTGYTATATGTGALSGYTYTINSSRHPRNTTVAPQGRASGQLLEHQGGDMRCLMPRAAAARGVTLIELMVAWRCWLCWWPQAAPYMGDMVTNSRLRESGNLLLAETLIAQSEAIKRNTPCACRHGADTVQVHDMTTPGRRCCCARAAAPTA
jgi:type IV pilus assembly protein PilE